MKILISLLLIISPFFALDSLACTCLPEPPVYELFDGADVVFTGKALKYIDVKRKVIVDGGDEGEDEEYETEDRIFQFEVIEVFKGEKSKIVEVNIGETKTSCSFNLSKNTSYLLFASKDKNTKVLDIGFCWGRTELNSAQAEISFIREKLKGKPQPLVYGGVVLRDTFPNSTTERNTLMQGVKITLEGKDKVDGKNRVFETLTDKNGLFRFYKIPDGEYEIKHSLKPEYRGYFGLFDHSFEIKDGKLLKKDSIRISYNGGAFYSLDVRWNNEVLGSVSDIQGNKVKFAAVRLLPVSSPFALIESDYNFDESEEGKFSCFSEAPGKYYLVAEIYASFGTKDKVRFFYPNEETIEKASTIEIKAPQSLNYDFVLPSNYLVKEIKGKVVWSNGEPADGAKVVLYKTENHVVDEDNDEIENRGYDSAFTDEFGSFTLQGFEGAEYWIHFENDWESENDEVEDIEVKGKPVKIKLEKDSETIKLILTKP